MRSWAKCAYLRVGYSGIQCHRSVRFGRGVVVQAFDGGSIKIGHGSFILDHAVVEAKGGSLILGPGSLVGRGSVIVATQEIVIGDGTLIAEYVTIRDQDHAHSGEAPLDNQGLAKAPIRIGHDVWLGAKVSVTKGVTIAPRCVIGANAVVTCSLTERGVYGGVPARLLRRVERDSESL